jgi:hypothetical protein
MQTVSAFILVLAILFGFGSCPAPAQEDFAKQAIFDDKLIIDGYAKKYQDESLNFILAMIRDDTIDPRKTAAAIIILQEKYINDLISREKIVAEKTLLRRLNKTDSAFVQVEVMSALCRLDRFQFFKTMMPELLLKIDHYDPAVSELAAAAVNNIIAKGNDKAWEARIVFGTLRKMFFLSRNKLNKTEAANPALKEKIKILRWSIKVLGSQELKSLPGEVIPLL